MEAADPNPYTPHLKKVLKSYQNSAMTSLNGPSKYEWDVGQNNGGPPKATVETRTPGFRETKKISIKEEKSECATPRQIPILSAPDQSNSKLEETLLQGETISCFDVGGEKRLCFPQVINLVLSGFKWMEINAMVSELRINIPHSNPKQLHELKFHQILPASAHNCGLITKSNAERLCSTLLYRWAPKLLPYQSESRPFAFHVEHECFGEGKGLCVPEWYDSPVSPCIECLYCAGVFCPDKFVCHVHGLQEIETCHWGFDSANWRSYLRISKDEGEKKKLEPYLDNFKAKFKHKRKQLTGDRNDICKKLKVETGESDCYPGVYMNGIRPPHVYHPHYLKTYPDRETHVPRHLRCPPVLQNSRRGVKGQPYQVGVEPNVSLAPRSKQVDDVGRTEPYLSTDSEDSAPDYLTSQFGEESKCDWVEMESVKAILRASSVGDDIVTQISLLLRRANQRISKHISYLSDENIRVGQEIERIRQCLSNSERQAKHSQAETERQLQEAVQNTHQLRRELENLRSQVGGGVMESKLSTMQRELTDLRQEIASFRVSTEGNQRGSVITSGTPE